ncbi:hypothetical protein LTR56_002604 [Elasticomyces elasticus]|nr:hypothetical protein LTR22_013505 [Elasticomyces elasticus]KAK3657090.1 hypothetical protein LTR56_002604 [Elasticomyces elasticus]KAK4926681.1 hypothetical protein LTR49_006363 [Elasticomyces elasticus]KAK5677901.1 hypothetical protein LTS10_009784 [Elasticomyces elasticus]KAK5762368.1 hypothetical protein LTS12_007527 [Elasticomyces elasticus]
MADENKPTAHHVEATDDQIEMQQSSLTNEKFYDDDGDERVPEARGRDASAIDKSYWLSARFLGSMAAIGLGFCGGTGGYALVAPVLSDINEDLGPSPNIAWVGLVYVLTEAVFFLLVGRLSDIFGSLIGLVGTIIGATAQSVNTLIGAEVLIGLAAAFQISFFWVICELVPVKWRYLANSYAYIVSIPTNPLAAKIAFSMQKTPIKWRGSFIFMAGVNALSALCWYLFYHPPTFQMLHRKKLAKDILLHFDWIGLLLYTAGLLIFLMGLSWGGGLYPWSDPHVIGTLVSGGITLFGIFPLWSIFLPLKNVEPFLPLHLFTNLNFQACAWLTGIGAGAYYGFSLIWPQAVSSLYTLSYDEQGTLAGLAAMGFVFGQVLGGGIATVIGPRWGIRLTMWIAAPIMLAAAANPQNQSLTEGLILTGSLMIGASEAQAAVTALSTLRSETDIGLAGGLAGTIRSFVSAIAVAIYSTVLSNRLKTTIPQYVTPAAEQAGLPASSVPSLLLGLGGTGNLTAGAVPGLTDAIQATAVTAFRFANSQAYKTVFFTSFAFGGAGMILVWFVADNDKSKENFVGGHVHDPRQEKALEVEEG